MERSGGGDSLRRDPRLDAELTAYERLLVADIIPAYCLLYLSCMDVDSNAAPDHDQLIAVQIRDAVFRFKRRLVIHLSLEVMFDNDLSLGERLLRVSLYEGLRVAEVRRVAV